MTSTVPPRSDPSGDRLDAPRRSAGHARTARPGASLRADLEGLRAIAVLGVVVYHLHPSWLPGGFAGVDVFFVLSGFFITGLLLREAGSTRRIDLRAFWARRARRLLPASTLVLVLTVGASFVFVDAIDARRFADDGVWTALFSVNWHFALQGTSYLSDPDPSPLTHFWSLGVEEQFYLVWPVALLGVAVLLGRRRALWLRPAVAAVSVVVVLASFLLAWRLTAGLQPFAYFATYSRVWQLALGGLLAAAAGPLSRLSLPLRTVARWGGLALVLGFYATASLDIVYPGWVALVPTLGAGLIVVSGLPRRHGRRVASAADPAWALLCSRGSQLLGRYSYGWYLWHWPPLVLLPLALGHALPWWALIASAVATFGAAVVSYHLLEHPVRTARPLVARHGRWSLALGAALVLVAAGSAQAITARAGHVVDTTTVRTASGRVLQPAPGVAAAEQNQAAPDGCELGQTVRANAPECRYLSDQGHGDVVLIGDSHAAQWLPALQTVGREDAWGLRVWTRENCPFADVTKVIDGAPNTACDDWRDDAVQRLVEQKPSLVVVSSYPPPGGPAVYDRDTGTTVSGSAAEQVYQRGMSRELARLTEAGIKVLLIQDLPRYDAAAPKCVLQNSADLSVCSAPEGTAEHAGIDAAAAAAVPGVATLDLQSRFCHDGRCYQVVGDVLAYRDNNHLSHEMIAELTPQVKSAMEQAVAA